MNKNITKAFLMHKNIEVARLVVDEESNILPEYYNSQKTDHIPLGGLLKDPYFKTYWWTDRAINSNRPGTQNALERLGYTSTKNMLLNNLGLSLSDCYWLKPYDSDARWEDVNLFRNDFKDYFGIVSIDPSAKIDKTEFFSPTTSNGMIPKKWVMTEDGKRVLIKYLRKCECQQSMNEVFASNINALQNFNNYVTYNRINLDLGNDNLGIGCACDCFCDEHKEFITADEVLQSMHYPHGSKIQPLRYFASKEGLNMEEFDRQMDYQIMLDFLISNCDRNTRNYGFLRDPDTLKVKQLAPIFDNGYSMLYENIVDYMFDPDEDFKIHAFEKTERFMLRHVNDRKVLDLNKLSSINFDAYKIDSERYNYKIDVLKSIFYRKIELLDCFQRGINIWKADEYKQYVPVNSYKPTQDELTFQCKKYAIEREAYNQEMFQDIIHESEQPINTTSQKDNVLSQTIKLSDTPILKRSNNVMDTAIVKDAINKSHITQNSEKSNHGISSFIPSHR